MTRWPCRNSSSCTPLECRAGSRPTRTGAGSSSRRLSRGVHRTVAGTSGRESIDEAAKDGRRVNDFGVSRRFLQ